MVEEVKTEKAGEVRNTTHAQIVLTLVGVLPKGPGEFKHK